MTTPDADKTLGDEVQLVDSVGTALLAAPLGEDDAALLKEGDCAELALGLKDAPWLAVTRPVPI